MTGGIDLFSPSSYASGHPVGQYQDVKVRLPDPRKAGQAGWLPSTFISGPKHVRVRHSRT